ncbi:MAG: PAAR domain-containing protein [Proteobacteria bacterium]|nr:PAAR domain-containing protein [Pseudomonadota bacterium]
MPKKIVLGDKTSHGGEVISAWGRDGPVPYDIDGIPVACIGDKVTCPKCRGTHEIVQGASEPPFMVGGRPVAREGDKCSCGAVLISKGQSRFTHGD